MQDVDKTILKEKIKEQYNKPGFNLFNFIKNY